MYDSFMIREFVFPSIFARVYIHICISASHTYNIWFQLYVTGSAFTEWVCAVFFSFFFSVPSAAILYNCFMTSIVYISNIKLKLKSFLLSVFLQLVLSVTNISKQFARFRMLVWINAIDGHDNFLPGFSLMCFVYYFANIICIMYVDCFRDCV